MAILYGAYLLLKQCKFHFVLCDEIFSCGNLYFKKIVLPLHHNI